MPPTPYFAATAPGLEALTAAELRLVGAKGARPVPGGVEFGGAAQTILRANLWLRTASRILVRVAEFHAGAFHELERHAGRVPWGRWIARGRPVSLSVTCRGSRLYHTGAVAERVLAAIVARAGAVAAGGVGPSEEDEDGEATGQRVFVRILGDRCTLSLDSTGELLHRRGYRQALSQAPLRETLAAAMLLACRWTGPLPLLDPMCGGGTIPIEAALLARRIAPGLGRSFAFEGWPEHDAAAWAALRDEARAAARPSAPAPILGSDLDPAAVEAALANAARAWVAADVRLEVRPLAQLEARAGPGLLLTNPPYGIRIGERAGLAGLYAELGRTARARLASWRVAALVPEDAPEAAFGLPLQSALETSNGGIRVRLLATPAGH